MDWGTVAQWVGAMAGSGALFLSIGQAMFLRGRASADAVTKVRTDLEAKVETLEDAAARNKTALEEKIDAHKEKVGQTFNRMGERLQAVETEQKNSITDDDIVAVHRRIDKLQDDMHAGMERLNATGTETAKTVARIEGLMQGWASKNPKGQDQ